MLLTQPLTQTINKTTDDVSVIIVLYNNPNFKGFARSFDLELCGKPMWKYVELATSAYPTKTTICGADTDLYKQIRPMLTNSQYTLVLYSDTPLIKSRTVQQIIDYAKRRSINCLKLARGYIFNTEYIKAVEEILGTEMEFFGDEDFTTVFDFRQLEFVQQIMKNRILEFHQKNGIYIKDNLSTFIDADVVIESGVVIEPFNILKGKTIISQNTFLGANNVIENSTIGSNCQILGAYIKDTKILADTKVQPFKKIEGQK